MMQTPATNRPENIALMNYEKSPLLRPPLDFAKLLTQTMISMFCIIPKSSRSENFACSIINVIIESQSDLRLQLRIPPVFVTASQLPSFWV